METKERKRILTMLVENNYGVTSRVSGVFSRRIQDQLRKDDRVKAGD